MFRRLNRIRKGLLTSGVDDLLGRDAEAAEDKDEDGPARVSTGGAVLGQIAFHDVLAEEDKERSDEQHLGEKTRNVLFSDNAVSGAVSCGPPERDSLEPRWRWRRPEAQSVLAGRRACSCWRRLRGVEKVDEKRRKNGHPEGTL